MSPPLNGKPVTVTPRSAACGLCLYFLRTGTVSNRGQCRRYPPAVLSAVTALGRGALASAFPAVSDEDFCGEFEAVSDVGAAVQAMGKKPFTVVEPSG